MRLLKFLGAKKKAVVKSDEDINAMIIHNFIYENYPHSYFLRKAPKNITFRRK